MLYNINDLKVGSDQDIILLIKCVSRENHKMELIRD